MTHTAKIKNFVTILFFSNVLNITFETPVPQIALIIDLPLLFVI